MFTSMGAYIAAQTGTLEHAIRTQGAFSESQPLGLSVPSASLRKRYDPASDLGSRA